MDFLNHNIVSFRINEELNRNKTKLIDTYDGIIPE